jgi:hypothetical protein
MCEAFMGIEPHFNLRNYFFHALLLYDSIADVAVLGGMDIYVRSGHIVGPYFHLPMSGPSDWWQKVWFFWRNDADASLSIFTGSRPIPQPNWGYGVAKKDLRELQPLLQVDQQLLHRGLTGVDLLWTFFSHRVQLLHQRGMTTWMYQGQCCHDHPFSEEFSDREINT